MPRPPRIPPRDSLPDDERESYDEIVSFDRYALPSQEVTRDGKKLFDWNYSDLIMGYYSRLLVNPGVPAVLHKLIETTLKAKKETPEGTFSEADHQLVDLVLCFDADYWCLLRTHTPLAVLAGVSVETIIALWKHREDTLDDDSRFVIQFIREVAAGTLTDDSWNRMESRLGSERGVFDFSVVICILQLHVRLHHVVKVAPISEEEYTSMLESLRVGPIQLTKAASTD